MCYSPVVEPDFALAVRKFLYSCISFENALSAFARNGKRVTAVGKRCHVEIDPVVPFRSPDCLFKADVFAVGECCSERDSGIFVQQDVRPQYLVRHGRIDIAAVGGIDKTDFQRRVFQLHFPRNIAEENRNGRIGIDAEIQLIFPLWDIADHILRHSGAFPFERFQFFRLIGLCSVVQGEANLRQTELRHSVMHHSVNFKLEDTVFAALECECAFPCGKGVIHRLEAVQFYIQERRRLKRARFRETRIGCAFRLSTGEAVAEDIEAPGIRRVFIDLHCPQRDRGFHRPEVFSGGSPDFRHSVPFVERIESTAVRIIIGQLKIGILSGAVYDEFIERHCFRIGNQIDFN